MGTKIIYLLIPFMTPFVFFLAAQITYDYGVLGLLGYAIMWALSFIIVFAVKNKKGFLAEDLVLRKATISIYITEIIICIFLVIKIILTQTVFEYLTFITLILMIVIPLFILYLNKLNEKLVSIGTILLGITISFLFPTLVYLKVSIPTVYSGIHFLSTELLEFNRSATWLLILGLGIILVVHQHVYRLMDVYYKEQHQAGPFFIAGAIATIVILSFGSISFLGRAQAVLPDLSDRVSIQVINRFGGQFGQLLFVGITIFIAFFVMTKLWESVKPTTKNPTFMFILKYLFVPGIVVTYFDITLLHVLLFFGLIWGPFLGLIFISVSSKVKTRITLACSIMISVVLAYQIDSVTGIICGACSSMLLMICFSLLELYKKEHISA